MLTLDSLNADKFIFVFLAIHFAEKTLPIWEEEYPEDMRPREAIKAAKAWLSNPGEETAAAARSAALAAGRAAADAARAAYAAANADYAARAAAAYAAANAAHAVANAAYYAARALNADKESLIHEVILENLDWILQYKIENGQSFAEPELIFDLLNEEQKQSFLFSLDTVV